MRLALAIVVLSAAVATAATPAPSSQPTSKPVVGPALSYKQILDANVDSIKTPSSISGEVKIDSIGKADAGTGKRQIKATAVIGNMGGSPITAMPKRQGVGVEKIAIAFSAGDDFPAVKVGECVSLSGQIRSALWASRQATPRVVELSLSDVKMSAK